MRVKITIFSLVVALIGGAGIINAQTPPIDRNFDVTVSPTFVELTSRPGATVSQSVRLRNNTSSQITLTPQVRIMGGDETGNLTIKETDEEHLEWISVEDSTVVLPPREWTAINFIIQVPDNAAFGYYWALTFTSEGEDIKTTGASINASLAVPILLTVVKEGAKTEGKLVDFRSDSSYYEYPPVTFITEFENTGNVHVRPRGNIFVKDFFGRNVATLEINEGQGGILPATKRIFEAVWNDGFITYEPKVRDGVEVIGNNGLPEMEMKIHYQKLLDLRIGRYTATALLLISGEERDYTYEKSITFFVFPWKVVLILIAIVIFVGIGLITTGKSIFRRVRKVFRRK